MAVDKIVSYRMSLNSATTENKEVAEILANGYRIIDVLTNSYNEGAMITVIMSNDPDPTPYQHTNKGG